MHDEMMKLFEEAKVTNELCFKEGLQCGPAKPMETD